MIRPFDGSVVNASWAERVVSPANDALTAAERHAYTEAHPDSYLHIIRSSDLDMVRELTPEEIAHENRKALDRLRQAGAFTHHGSAMFLYRLDTGEHVQTALVADIDLVGMDNGQILPHERTRTDREDQLALALRVVGVNSSPVAMATNSEHTLIEVIDKTGHAEPILDFMGAGRLHQMVWRVPDVLAHAAAADLADTKLHVTDGHHRLAAALRHRDNLERNNPGQPGLHHQTLVAIFPASQMQTFAFHRTVVTDLSIKDVLAAMTAHGLEPVPTDMDHVEPQSPGEFGLYVAGGWYRFSPNRRVDVLDVQWLQDDVIAPVFGITSPSSDPRLNHLTGSAGPLALADKCDRLGAIGLLLAPTPVEAIAATADRGEILPPKSSFFSPKPRSGIFLAPRT